MTDPASRLREAVAWPPEGVVRVHADPAALPRLGDDPGANRFDDPRPRTVDRFLMRYAATTLRGCLLELLAWLRGNPAAEERIAAVHSDDADLVEAPAVPMWQPLADYLQGRRVANITGKDLAVTSINDPALQRELDDEPAVRAVLDTPAARQALLPRRHAAVALDNAAVRLASDIGRYITQACALALFDRTARPDAIHYPSTTPKTAGPSRTTPTCRPGTPSHSYPTDQTTPRQSPPSRLWNLSLPPAWN